MGSLYLYIYMQILARGWNVFFVDYGERLKHMKGNILRNILQDDCGLVSVACFMKITCS